MQPYPANLWLTYRTVRYRPQHLRCLWLKAGGVLNTFQLGKRLVTMAARFPVLNPVTAVLQAAPIPSVSEIPPIPEPVFLYLDVITLKPPTTTAARIMNNDKSNDRLRRT